MGVTRGTARSWSAPRPFWQIQPGVVSFNAAISACAVGSEWERALQLLRALPQTLGLRSDSELGRASWEGSQCKNHQATKFVLWVTCFVSPDTCFQRRLPIWLWFVAGLSLRLRLAGNVVTATACDQRMCHSTCLAGSLGDLEEAFIRNETICDAWI